MFDNIDSLLERLRLPDGAGYYKGAPAATEPVALAALALSAFRRYEQASPLIEWLLEAQQDDGSLGVDRREIRPTWPTGWGLTAWHVWETRSTPGDGLRAAIQQAKSAICRSAGITSRRRDGDHFGHDPSIEGWSWVDQTDAWVEPTAINVLALRHIGECAHTRVRHGIELLQDRLLSSGGINYGNTTVFGSELRPQLQPTGLTLLALAGQTDSSGKIAKAIHYLKTRLSSRTPTVSLCYSLLGLAAQKSLPINATEWLRTATDRTLSRDPGGYPLALLALASQGPSSVLIPQGET